MTAMRQLECVWMIIWVVGEAESCYVMIEMDMKFRVEKVENVGKVGWFKYYCIKLGVPNQISLAALA